MSERILITGGAGFLGNALAAGICGRYEVVILDSLKRNVSGYNDLPGHAGVELVRGDVLDGGCVARALRGCHRVVHMASVAGVSAVRAQPVRTMRTALMGTANVLEACREKGDVRRVVILSSSEVYGRHARRAGEEDAVMPVGPMDVRWCYAVSKLAAEYLGFSYYRQFGLPVTSVRPFNVYGPAQVGEGGVHTFVERALLQKPLVLHNGGRQVRAWCYLDDMTAGLVKVLTEDAAVGRVFNLGNPDCAITVRELAERVVRLSGSSSSLEEKLHPGLDVDVRTPDISRAQELLGFAPRVGLEEGLRRTLEWYREHGCLQEAADG
jgi:nucleoside-diphosphate-sugar epimerase